MAYQTGTSSSTADLLDKLRAFLLASGWTIEAWRFQIANPTWRWLAVSKSGWFFNIAEYLAVLNAGSHPTVNNLQLAWATSYASGSDFGSQPGSEAINYAPTLTPPYTSYHFFDGVGASGPYCHVAVELGAGEFRHFGFGVLDKVGTYTGGQFLYTTTWDMQVGRVNNPNGGYHGMPFDSTSTTTVGLQQNATSVRCVESPGGGALLGYYGGVPAGQQLRCGGYFGHSGIGGTNLSGTPSWAFWIAGPITSIGVAPLQRVPCFGDRGSSQFALIGEPPGFRHIDVTFLNPGDEITLGSEVWKTFPLVRKGSSSANIPVSSMFGLAFRKS